MKKLSDFMNDKGEASDGPDSSTHIIVVINKDLLLDHSSEHLLNEGQWRPSEVSGYWKRVDKPKHDFERRHVHIAKQKHINAKSKQVSWNDDGTRHDKKSFNVYFDGLETAKQIARNALGLDSSIVLEQIEDLQIGSLLMEGIESMPESAAVYILEAKSGKSTKRLLNS